MLITGSIVIYKTSKELLQEAISSFIRTKLPVRLFLIDNSPDARLSELASIDQRIEYIHTKQNLGFGKGHNIGIAKSLQAGSQFHLILNPDVHYSEGTLEGLIGYMKEHEEIGLVMPKVLNIDGTLQYLCKEEPRPFDLICRRFIPSFLKPLFRKRLESYELRHKSHEEVMEVPFLSGCFMLVRSKVFSKVGMFDEKFFMYLEDLDFCRRVSTYFRLVYYPEVSIYHHYGKGSYKKLRLMFIHAKSAITYFNKWGWQPFF